MGAVSSRLSLWLALDAGCWKTKLIAKIPVVARP